MFVGIAINLTGRLLSSTSPASLFANGEVGVWYDPSQINTLFQDSAGTTPVTAPNQPVGLMLDKSQGALLGPELVTNGNFSSGTTGWTSVNATISVVSGSLRITATSLGVAPYAVTSVATAVGKTYLLNATLVADAMTGNSFLYVGTTSGSGDISNKNLGSTPQTSTLTFVATSTTTYISLSGNSFALVGEYIDWDNISCKLTAGYPAFQPTSTQRPTYQIDSSGKPYLLFDGVDDGMVTGTITPAIDKVQVFAGVRKLSDVAQGIFCEFSADTGSNNGSFRMTFPGGNGVASYAWLSKGTLQSSITSNAWSAPITNVVSAIGDISNDAATIRVNGITGNSATDQGTGNYLAYPLYIGRRGGTSLPYNGRLYSLITRFGANLTDGQITSTESWVNGETGAY